MDGSSEDVSEFLLRIKELGDKRVKEDEERTRKLEEEILQGRKERQARRAGKPKTTNYPLSDSPIYPALKIEHSNAPFLSVFVTLEMVGVHYWSKHW